MPSKDDLLKMNVPIIGGNREQRRAQGQRGPQRIPAPEPANGHVAIGICTDENVSHIFLMSLTGLLAYRLPIIGNRVLIGQGDMGHLDVGRNKVVQEYLNTPAQVEWLLFIDTDMAFNPREFDLLYEAAHPTERPFVSALYYMNDRPPRPVAFDHEFSYKTGMTTATSIKDYPDNELVEVEGVGFGFNLIHRSLYEKVAEEFGPSAPHRPWFDNSYLGPYSEPPSEDLSFCARVRELGVPIYVHTGATVGHVKSVVLVGENVSAGS